MALAGHGHRLGHGERREQPGLLERSAQPGRRPLVGRPVGDLHARGSRCVPPSIGRGSPRCSRRASSCRRRSGRSARRSRPPPPAGRRRRPRRCRRSASPRRGTRGRCRCASAGRARARRADLAERGRRCRRPCRRAWRRWSGRRSTRLRRRSVAAPSSMRCRRRHVSACAPSMNTDRRMSGRSSSSRVGPSKRTVPFSRNTARSARVSATFTDCSTTTIVVPSRQLARTTSMSCATIVGARPEGQLVDEQHLGPEHQRLASASCCCSPPDRSPASWSSAARRTGNIGAPRLSVAAMRWRSLAERPAREPQVLGDRSASGRSLRPRA